MNTTANESRADTVESCTCRKNCSAVASESEVSLPAAAGPEVSGISIGLRRWIAPERRTISARPWPTSPIFVRCASTSRNAHWPLMPTRQHSTLRQPRYAISGSIRYWFNQHRQQFRRAQGSDFRGAAIALALAIGAEAIDYLAPGNDRDEGIGNVRRCCGHLVFRHRNLPQGIGCPAARSVEHECPDGRGRDRRLPHRAVARSGNGHGALCDRRADRSAFSRSREERGTARTNAG